jgi:hypothetical protein
MFLNPLTWRYPSNKVTNHLLSTGFYQNHICVNKRILGVLERES